MKHSSTCMECEAAAQSHSRQQHSRHLTVTETTFTCGARLQETSDRENNTGSVVFEGCTCG